MTTIEPELGARTLHAPVPGLIAGALWIARRILPAPAAPARDVPAWVESETP